MDNFGEGHPCAGKDCLQCETCIFDRDLFEEHITPNERLKKESKNNNLNNMCSSRLCNGCVNLEKSYENCLPNHFDAACKAASYTAFGVSRARRIDYNLSISHSIVAPNWCPLKDSKAQLLLTATPEVPTRPRPQDTGPRSTQPPTSYSDKRERMKGLRKHIEWDDIEEGKIYVIPKILSQARKIVKVITKTNMSCICHEISEYTGNEYNFNCTVYPSDLDAVFITELRNF